MCKTEGSDKAKRSKGDNWHHSDHGDWVCYSTSLDAVNFTQMKFCSNDLILEYLHHFNIFKPLSITTFKWKKIPATWGYWQRHRSEISLSYRYHNHGRNYLNDRPSLRSALGTNILIYSYHDCWQSLLYTCPPVQAVGPPTVLVIYQSV